MIGQRLRPISGRLSDSNLDRSACGRLVAVQTLPWFDSDCLSPVPALLAQSLHLRAARLPAGWPTSRFTTQTNTSTSITSIGERTSRRSRAGVWVGSVSEVGSALRLGVGSRVGVVAVSGSKRMRSGPERSPCLACAGPAGLPSLFRL